MYGYPGQQPPQQQPQQPTGGYPGYPPMQAPPQQGGYGAPMAGPQPGAGLPYGLAPQPQPAAMPYGGNAMPYGQPIMQQPQGMMQQPQGMMQQPQGMPMQQGMPMMQQQHPGMMPMQQQQMPPMGYPAAMMQPQSQLGAYPGMDMGRGAGGQGDIVTMQFTGKKLENKDNFSRSDPYYTISKTMGSGQFVEVIRSNVVNDSLNPSWAPITIRVSDLCNGDYDRQLKIEVMDHDNHGNNDMIGSFTTTLNMLKASQGAGQPFQLVNPKKQSRLLYKNSGTLHLGQFSIQKKSF